MICLLAVVPVYLKNYFLFGGFEASTGMGMNFAKITLWQVPAEEKKKLVDNGRLSQLAVLGPFRHLPEYGDISPKDKRYPEIFLLHS